jgi:hypothetical protein
VEINVLYFGQASQICTNEVDKDIIMATMAIISDHLANLLDDCSLLKAKRLKSSYEASIPNCGLA